MCAVCTARNRRMCREGGHVIAHCPYCRAHYGRPFQRVVINPMDLPGVVPLLNGFVDSFVDEFLGLPEDRQIEFLNQQIQVLNVRLEELRIPPNIDVDIFQPLGTVQVPQQFELSDTELEYNINYQFGPPGTLEERLNLDSLMVCYFWLPYYIFSKKNNSSFFHFFRSQVKHLSLQILKIKFLLNLDKYIQIYWHLNNFKINCFNKCKVI